MIKSIHIVLSVALTICSFGFALDKPIKAKSNQSTLFVQKDIKIDKKDIGKNPRLEKAERVIADKIIKQNRVQFLMPGGRSITNAQAVDRFGPGAFDLESEGVIALPKRSRKDLLRENNPSSRDELWNLSYMNESDAYYYLGSGAANDTFATVFTPAAPCVVKEVYYQWFSAGNTIAFGADYGNADLISPDGDCYDIARGDAYHVEEGTTDTTWVTPIGTPRTTATPNTIAGYVSDWGPDAFLDIGGEFVVGDSTDLSAVDQFAIAAIKGGETPQPLACNNDAIGKTTTYTWFGGPWTDGLWGRYHYITDNMVLVKVTYPWGAPIAVASVSQPSNTYDLAGTRTIDVDLFDDEDDTGAALDENDTLTYYYVAGGDTTTGALTASAEVATNGNGIYQFDISYSLFVGDSVEYWVELMDNDGLESKSAIKYFNIVQPWNESSDILLVVDNIDVDQESVLLNAMDNSGFVYEVWDVQVNKGIDASVINHGWDNIIVSGWGVSSVPVTDQPDPGYRTFVEDGYNLVLMDMDFFYGHGLDPEPAFVEGNFMYDVFGVSGGANDPMNDAGDASLHGDTLTVYGAGVTSFDTPFADGYTQNHTILMTAGWTDLIEANDADEIFYDADDNVVGTNLQTGDNGTAIYLSFMPEAAVDWDIVDGDTLGWDISAVVEFMGALLGHLEAVSPPLVDLEGTSTRFGVASGITTAHVEGMAVDGDGTLTSVSVVYDIDGTDYTEAMTDDGEGHFSATLTLTAWTDTSTCSYQLSATDNDGLTSLTGIGQFWGTSFVPTDGNILYIEDSYGPYAGYGPADADSVLKENMDAVGAAYDKWVVWDNFQPDPGSVLSHYDAVIYSGVLDWVMNPEGTDVHPLGEFVADGGFLLYSSNEALGTYTDWEDITISEGHFVHDVLGVEWVMNDIAYDSVFVSDPDLAITADMDTNDIAFNCYTYPFDCSFNDIVDPLGWGTDDMLPSPFMSADAGLPSWTGGEYYVSTENGNVVFMGFIFPELPNDVQQAALGNFLAWSGSTVSNEEEPNLPTQFALYENYPNPFNPVTTIRFDVPEVSDVNITVYNVLGKQVNSIDLNTMSPGKHHIKWRGIDNAGKPVSSGLYFYTIKAGDFFATKKMMLLK